MGWVTPCAAHGPRDISAVDVPAEKGRLTVLARHEPMVCSLREGLLLVDDAEGQREQWRIGPGVMHVGRERVTVLTDSAAQS